MVLECSQDFGVLPGFWSAPRILELNVKIYPTFFEKAFIKGSLTPKIKKRENCKFQTKSFSE